jgi:hypothetical protein
MFPARGFREFTVHGPNICPNESVWRPYMVALNVVLMAAVILVIACALAGAIVSDRRSKRAAGGAVPPTDAPLHRNLMMPRGLRRERTHHLHLRRNRSRSTTV